MSGAHPSIPGLTNWRALARGGFATVWEARQESLNRLVAVKIDQRTLDTEPERRRFLREAGAAGRMSGYPGIVTVHDAGILNDNRPYLVMQLCPGGSLTAWVKAEERPAQEDVREVGVRVADALAAAHARGVMHRDVKPANILIDDYGKAGLADFGLAAVPDPGLELSDTIEALTPAYAPPEMFHRAQPSEFGDVYSLAATLYALLSGRPPRWPETGTPTSADMLQRHADPVEPIPGVADELMAALLSALADDPGERPSAAQFRDRLRSVDLHPPVVEPEPEAVPEVEAGALPGPVPPDGAGPDSEAAQWSHEPWPARRNGVLVAVVVMMLLAGLVAAFLAFGPRNPTARPPLPTTAQPSPTTAPASEDTSPTPTATAPARPAGFVDCAEALGADAYCPVVEECYRAVGTYGEGLWVGNDIDCEEVHVYQTFAAGRLDETIVRQSTLEGLESVQQLCTAENANRMLATRERQDGWEIIMLGPQAEGEHFFRCLFGDGEIEGPYRLSPPS